MRVKILLLVFFFVLGRSYAGQPGKKLMNDNDVFGTRIFIENKGQFNSYINTGDAVKYALLNGEENIFFTPKGLVYKYTKRYAISERKREQAEHGKNVKFKQDVCYYVSMKWVNANTNITIEEGEKQDRYFTYGTAELKSYVYKKITYKNVYKGIDIEYTIPEDKGYGIKYNVIVHPGANPNDVKILYTGDVNGISKTKEGDIIIKTPMDDIIEHAPKSFYGNKETVSSEFTLQDDAIGFNFQNGYQNTKTLIVDPWVTNTTSLPATNYAYDVDYDYNGNLFVYGGGIPFYTAKYSPAGALLWTFGGIVAVPAWNGSGATNYVSNFCVNRNTGKAYIGQGWVPAGGTRVIRLDVNGIYDNFISAAVPNWQEIWDMGFQCSTGNVFGMGGSPAANFSCGSINQVSGAVVATSFMAGNPAASQDIASSVIDDAGNAFIYYTSSNAAFVNTIAKINTAFTNTMWVQPSTYNVMAYCFTKGNYVGAGGLLSNGFNCLAVNGNYLYFYDGSNLAVYNKLTGVKLAFIVVPGLALRAQGGIDVDDCDNVYIGGNNNILAYNFNGTTFSALASIPVGAASPNKYVYDLKLDKTTNTLYACGSGFAGTYSAIHSIACIVNQYSVTTTCVGNNNGTAVASLTTTIANPLITYIWTNITGTVSSTINSPVTSNTVTNLTNGTYTVSMQINAPCGPLYTTTLNINCQCSATVAAITACPPGGNTTSLTVVAVNGFTPAPTFTWTGPGSYSSTVQNPLFLNNNVYGTYTLFANNGNCVATTTITTIPVSSFTPAITNTAVTCNGLGNGIATTTVVGGILPFTYTWTTLPPQNTANANNLTPGIYTVTVKDNSGCAFTATTQITQPPALTLAIVPSATLTCVNSAITLTGTTIGGVGPVYNYTWSAGPNTNTNSVTQAVAGNYPYILSSTDANNCVVTNTVTLAFVPNPTVVVASVSVCAGQTATFTANGATTYTWNPTNLNGNTFTVNPVANATYTILGSSGSCTSQSTASVTVNVSPVANAVNNGPICEFNNLVLTGNGGTGYAWTGPLNYTNATQNPTLALAVNSQSGTYTLVVTDANGCQASATTNVVINSAPAILANGGTVCFGYPLVLTATGGANYAWSGPNGFVSNLQNPTIPSVNNSNSGTYNVIVTAANTCTSASAVSVGTYSLPVPTITATPIACLNTPVNLQGTPGFLLYQWTGPNNFLSPNANTSFTPSAMGESGMYTLSVTDARGCVGSTSTLIALHPLPLANITLDLNKKCVPFCSNLSLQNTVGAVSLVSASWQINGQNFSGTNLNYCITAGGDYLIKATFTDANGCPNSNTYTLNAYPVPTAMFEFSPLTPIEEIGEVKFTDGSKGPGINTWNWYFINNNTQSSLQNPSYTFPKAGSYPIALVVTNKWGCADTVVKSISVVEDKSFYLPNSFTPNGDGINDIFLPKGYNILKYEMSIFDRWGEKLFTTTDLANGWDGTYKGTDSKEDVYVWKVSLTTNDAKVKVYTGHVTLMK